MTSTDTSKPRAHRWGRARIPKTESRMALLRLTGRMVRIVATRALIVLSIFTGFVLLLSLGWSVIADAVLTRPTVPPPGDTGQFITVDGVRTYYRSSGHGPPLVLLHGLGSSHLTWSAVENALA